MIKTPEVTTLSDGRVVLRKPDLLDVDEIYAGVRDSQAEIGQWMSWARPDYSREDAADWLARTWLAWRAGTVFEFMVTHPEDGRLLGLCGLNQISREDGTANLGYWMRTDEAGNGYCTAAARLLARFGFEQVGLRRIRLFHDVDNIGSQRVAEKIGFVREGVRRRHSRQLDGRLADTVLYSLIDAGEIRG